MVEVKVEMDLEQESYGRLCLDNAFVTDPGLDMWPESSGIEICVESTPELSGIEITIESTPDQDDVVEFDNQDQTRCGATPPNSPSSSFQLSNISPKRPRLTVVEQGMGMEDVVIVRDMGPPDQQRYLDLVTEMECEPELVAVQWEEEVTPKVERKSEEKICISGVNIIDDLTQLLHDAAFPILTRDECQTIFKNLIIFVGMNHSVALADNLFKMDQVRNVHCYNINSLEQIRYRNWQWVLQSFSPQAQQHHERMVVQELAYRKSKAVEIGRLMNAEEGHVRLIIGFWLFKLIRVRLPNLMLHLIPISVRAAYQGFIKWQVPEWQKRRLPFETPEKFKLVFEILKKNKVPPKNGGKLFHLVSRFRKFWMGKGVVAETEVAAEFCKRVGSKRLSVLYLPNSFEGTLKELTTYWNEQNKERKDEINCLEQLYVEMMDKIKEYEIKNV